MKNSVWLFLYLVLHASGWGKLDVTGMLRPWLGGLGIG
jgi:hypothetical protein